MHNNTTMLIQILVKLVLLIAKIAQGQPWTNVLNFTKEETVRTELIEIGKLGNAHNVTLCVQYVLEIHGLNAKLFTPTI